MVTMSGVVLPGDSTVKHVQVDVPEPGHGQVLLRMKASSICGSDIRAIYREHLGSGPEAYRGVIAGHEPCGQVAAVGPGCRRLSVGDRVVVYHIAGCGVCEECRRPWFDPCERWRLYLDPEELGLTVPYCPDCAAREFDGD